MSADPLADALAPVLVERCGGLVLHAAASQIDGEAIAFVGPSGAGKTTAVAQAGEPLFARDKLIVAKLPHTDRWWCWPLAQGSRAEGVPESTATALPLRAIARVSHARGTETGGRRLGVAEATFVIRESTVPLVETVAAEADRLDTAMSLASDVAVCRLETVLGRSPLPRLRGMLH